MKRNLNTCRICLRFGISVDSNSKSLFEMHNSSLISNSLFLIANVKIHADDGLPSKICGECLLELDAAINFKDKCERSNKLLHFINEDEEEKSNTFPNAEIPIPIELAKKEDTSEDELQFEIEYYDDAENDFQIKSELDQTHNELATEDKPELKTEESDDALATSDIHQPDLKKSKAIDLKLICDDCGGSFKSKCKLRMHWKKVHMAEKLICNYCKRVFKSYITLHRHLKKRPKNCLLASETRIEGVGKSRVLHCRNCDYQTKRAHKLHWHFNIHTGNRSYVCKLCSKDFMQQGTLDSHNELVHKIIKKAIICQFCGQSVMGRQKIQKHLNKHTRSPLQCDICKKMFKSKQILINHLKCHSGVKAYKCEKCAAAFYTIASLRNHIKQNHSNIKVMYICDICGYKPTRAACLERHKLKHINCNICCNVCGRFYSDTEQLVSHQRVHTKEKPECLLCNKIFNDNQSFNRHNASAAHKRKQNILIEKVVRVKKKEDTSTIDCKDEKVAVEICPFMK